MDLVKRCNENMVDATELDPNLSKPHALVGCVVDNLKVLMRRSVPKVLERDFLPCSLGNGMGILQLMVFGLNDTFESWYHQILLESCKELYRLIPKVEIWDCARVEKIFAGRDGEWVVRVVEIAENGYITLLICQQDRFLEAEEFKDLIDEVRRRLSVVQWGEEDYSSLPEGIKSITLDLNYCSYRNWGIKIAHFCTEPMAPDKITIIKTKDDEDLGMEWVLASCCPDLGSTVYRFYPGEDPMIQTIEYYEPNIKIMPCYL